MLDYIDKKIINILSEGLPMSKTPFREIAGVIGIEENEVLRRIDGYFKNGKIRRFGAILNHYILGFCVNAMGVWLVPIEMVEEVAEVMVSFPEVSHCYERKAYSEWPYNLYTMIHGREREDCERIASEISKSTGIKNYKLLYTLKEYKKSCMKYFNEI